MTETTPEAETSLKTPKHAFRIEVEADGSEDEIGNLVGDVLTESFGGIVKVDSWRFVERKMNSAKASQGFEALCVVENEVIKLRIAAAWNSPEENAYDAVLAIIQFIQAAERDKKRAEINGAQIT